MSTAREKKALWSSIEKERRKAAKATLKERQALIKGTRASKKPALAAARSECELARIEARSSCAARKARIHADVYDIVTKTRALIDEDKQFAADLRRIEAGNRKRKGPSVSRAVARAESDDEVRQNIDPSFVVLFNQVRKGIKGSARKTRTEEFLEYAETHPDEVFATIDEDAHIAELERRQSRANPRKLSGFAARKVSPGFVAKEKLYARLWQDPKYVAMREAYEAELRLWNRLDAYKHTPSGEPEELAASIARQKRQAAVLHAYEDAAVGTTDAESIALAARVKNPRMRQTSMFGGGAPVAAEQLGFVGPQTAAERKALAEYEEKHWGHRGKGRMTSLDFPDPRIVPAVLGQLIQCTYRTIKDEGEVDYFHDFSKSKPTWLAFNHEGLLISAGNFKVKEGGITG